MSAAIIWPACATVSDSRSIGVTVGNSKSAVCEVPSERSTSKRRHVPAQSGLVWNPYV